MKATGIVRRIDDLGRVVVPKEIRRTLRIREGDPLEIFTDREGEIILKKYSPIGELGTFAQQYADSLAQTTGYTVFVTDRDSVIAGAGGSKKDYLGKGMSPELEAVIQNREMVQAASPARRTLSPIVADRKEETGAQTLVSVICEGDAMGSVMLYAKDAKAKMGVDGTEPGSYSSCISGKTDGTVKSIQM